VLYLHGNRISRLPEVQRIARVCELRKLTLHGNPIESNRHYRNYVLFHCRGLQQLDFSCITKQQMLNVATWAQTYRKKLKLTDASATSGPAASSVSSPTRGVA
jgi:hypothetical protein